MSTITKEQLIASAHARIEFAEMMLAGELEPLKERTWSIELELARIALASLEAQDWKDIALEHAAEIDRLKKLVIRVPMPVVVPESVADELKLREVG